MSGRSKIHCRHCGKLIEPSGYNTAYTVAVDPDTARIMIVNGIADSGELYYCSENCMFRREEGHPPLCAIEKFLDLDNPRP